MKTISRIGVAGIALFVMHVVEIPYLSEMLVPEAQARRGRGAAFAAGDPGINQPGAAGNVGRNPGINQPGAAGNVGLDPGINQPGAAGNR